MPAGQIGAGWRGPQCGLRRGALQQVVVRDAALCLRGTPDLDGRDHYTGKRLTGQTGSFPEQVGLRGVLLPAQEQDA